MIDFVFNLIFPQSMKYPGRKREDLYGVGFRTIVSQLIVSWVKTLDVIWPCQEMLLGAGMGVTTNRNGVAISCGHNHWSDSVISKPNHLCDQPLCSREQIRDLIAWVTTAWQRWWLWSHISFQAQMKHDEFPLFLTAAVSLTAITC